MPLLMKIIQHDVTETEDAESSLFQMNPAKDPIELNSVTTAFAHICGKTQAGRLITRSKTLWTSFQV